jgi:hypothetical protein
MDTGSIMANKMSEQIEASEYHYEQACEKLNEDIAAYIKECGYTWTVEEIIKQYREQYKKGYYVSFTCKEIIKKFESELGRLVQTS